MRIDNKRDTIKEIFMWIAIVAISVSIIYEMNMDIKTKTPGEILYEKTHK